MGKGLPTSAILKGLLIGLYVFAFAGVVGFIALHGNLQVLNPQGTIADQQKTLMIIAVLLMVTIILPVFVLTFGIAWKYRASNTKARHEPEWDHSRVLETIWWGFPCLIITILAVFTVVSSRTLDPFRSLASDKPPLHIQVVALQWKWLFIYPDQEIASVNQVRFPEKTPVDFEITSDAPMNSFWIPSLGGQIYAMSGMSTHLHLMADKIGTYNGSSANISGEGFAGMKFIAQSMSETDFKTWAQSAKAISSPLDVNAYNDLAPPSKNNPVKTYSLADQDLYDKIIMKYMSDGSEGGMKH